MEKPKKWTDEEFLEAAAAAFEDSAISRYDRLLQEARRLEEVARGRAERGRTWSDEDFLSAARAAFE